MMSFFQHNPQDSALYSEKKSQGTLFSPNLSFDLHKPVLYEPLKKLFSSLAPSLPQGFVVDGTFGRGGHSSLLHHLFPSHPLVVFDKDEEAKLSAKEQGFFALESFFFFHDSFRFLKDRLFSLGEDPRFSTWIPPFCSMIFLDLGVSSPQLDQGHRGFSFQQEGPLDMRMDQRQDFRAQDIVNHFSEEALADIFYYYGEERHSRFFARRIVDKRPFYNTLELASFLQKEYYRKYGHLKKNKDYLHPATRIFQSLRIAVNHELEDLKIILQDAMDLLVPGGIFCVLSFHSLEDTLVKNCFRKGQGITNKKPMEATEEEISNNPRSRSVKGRWFQKS